MSTQASRKVIVQEKLNPPGGTSYRRSRLVTRSSELRQRGVGLLHGPAGIGKTSALLDLAAGWDGEVSWLRVDSGDADAEGFNQLLAAALGVSPAGSSIDHVIAAVEDARITNRLLVIDDVHALIDSEGADALGRLLRYRPPELTLVASSRCDRNADTVHRRLSDSGLVLDFEELRFRLWEVDELFRLHFDMPISQEELHLLSRHTDGWAAALKMFSVVARGAEPIDRLRMIDRLRTSSGLAHDYLTQEVLLSLADTQRDFLLATSVFEQLTSARCDALLERRSSSVLLRQLNHLGLFAYASEAADSYRCHDLLRTHLLAEFTTREGQSAADAQHRRAGTIAESEGIVEEAVRYFSRGDDLDAVQRLLDARGERLAQTAGRWLDVVPSALLRQDPFVLLTLARRSLRSGDLHAARERFREASKAFEGHDGAAQACRSELRLLNSWLSEEPVPATSWISTAKQQLSGRPVLARDVTDAPNRALLHLIEGDLNRSKACFEEMEASTQGFTSLLAASCRLVLDLLSSGSVDRSALRRTQLSAKRLDSPSLERLAEAIARGSRGGSEADSLVAGAQAANDALGEAAILFVSGLHDLFSATESPAFDAAAHAFDAAGCAVLAEIAGILAGNAGARANRQLHRRVNPLQHALTLAFTTSDDNRRQQAVDLGRRCGAEGLIIAVLEASAADRTSSQAPPPQPTIRLLGDVAILDQSGDVCVVELTPQHREVLAFLSCNADTWVHSDRIIDNFWPSMDGRRARRNMQVAISAIRKSIESHGIGTVERQGSRYRLALGAAARTDLLDLERDLSEIEATPLTAAPVLLATLQRWAEPVADHGAADWAVEVRGNLRRCLTRAVLKVTRASVDAGDIATAHQIALAALETDRSVDDVWSLAISTAGPAEAIELERAYDSMLVSLGA